MLIGFKAFELVTTRVDIEKQLEERTWRWAWSSRRSSSA